MQLLIMAVLAAAGCNNNEDISCPGIPEVPFEHVEDIDEATVQELLAEHAVSDPAALACNAVCESLYRRSGPENDGSITGLETCELAIDGELTGDAATIVGDLRCSGQVETYFCRGGRRPLGHVDVPPADPGLPAHLAHLARLEAASVVAFTELAGRLQAWGAPAALVERCRTAAGEEAVHADLLGALAREAGATVEPATGRSVAVDLERAALDNAIEGCVYEAWSALTCAVTARDGATPVLRAVHARLAVDEAGHAELAWDLHTWFMGQVTPAQRSAIVAAQQAALASLPAIAGAQQREAPAALALPDARVAARFAAAVARAA